MKNNVSQYLSSIISDVFDALPVPMKETAKVAFRNLMEDRIQKARDILIEEIRAGEKDVWDACDVDEVVAIVYRYMRAAQEGTAQTNLRLLARIIAGQKATKALKADDFLYYSDIIASLRHEEIVLIGVMYKIMKKETPVGEAWVKAQGVWQHAKKELVPEVFATEEEFVAMSGALARTGLVIPVNAIGGMIFIPSPFMEKLCSLASFENLEKECGMTLVSGAT